MNNHPNTIPPKTFQAILEFTKKYQNIIKKFVADNKIDWSERDESNLQMFFDYSTNAYSNNTIVKMFQYNNPTDFLVGRDRLPNVDATEKEINTAIQEGEEIIEDMVIQLSGEHGPLFDLMECPNPKNPEEMVYDTDEFLELQTKFQSDLKKLIIENGMGLKDYAHNRWYRPGNNVFDKVDRRATIMYNKIANQFSDKINPYIIKNKQK